MTRWIKFGAVLAVALVAVGACASDTQPAAGDGPEAVVASFYGWYLEQAGFDPETQERRNPLQEGAYRDRDELTPDLVTRLDDMVASPQGLPADPLLCAQDVPESIDAGEPVIEGDRATVPVTSSFANHTFTVELQQMDGAWKIDRISCAP